MGFFCSSCGDYGITAVGNQNLKLVLNLRTNQNIQPQKERTVSDKNERDVEKEYPLPQFIEKIRRLADALEKGEQFEIMIAGERIYVPVRAIYTIEHEREDDEEEIEFQIKWKL